MQLIGVDVGGTFTDIVYTDTVNRSTLIHKVATTPNDPSQGVLTGITELCQRHDINPASVAHVLHGTTTATNAVLQQDGALTGMITTDGYRDIVHIGRHQRPQPYSIRQEIPWQDRVLVKRRYRLTVPERLAPPSGEVLTPLDEEAVRKAARELKTAGVEAVAVCFLFSYLDPAHERRAAEIVREEFPQAFISCSALVSPQFREFERFTTALMNAYIGPKISRYVTELDGKLNELGIKDLHVMGSNGGVATAAMVLDKPILTVLSGPAAGVLGGRWAGSLCDRNDLITFDVGGTSADIGIVHGSQIGEAAARDTWIAGYPLMVPMMDIHTIGAGGGSVAFRDHGGAFQVGPRSAGAVPGPAAYGRGGSEPTVTDANLVLGRLDAENFLGGAMHLDDDAAQRAVGTLATQLGLSLEQTAAGILTIVNANMANAIRSRTVQKGIDPRGFSLVAFGGAGPLHGAEVAAQLGIPEVIVPPYPGMTSAVGLLTTDLKYDLIKTEFMNQQAVDVAQLNTDLDALQTELQRQLNAAGIEDPQAVQFSRAADLRYVGQGYELRVALPTHGTLSSADVEQLWADFHAQHEKEYGHTFGDSPIELVNLRMTGVGVMPKIGPPMVATSDRTEPLKTGQCVFRVDDQLQAFATAFYARQQLPLDTLLDGPAVVLQTDTTTVVPPGWKFRALADGNLLLTLSSDC